jgi:replicative DNA helicase
MNSDIFNLAAEEAVLGACLHTPDALDSVRENLKAHDFFNEELQHIFNLCCDQQDKGQPFNAVVLNPILKLQGMDEPGTILAHLQANRSVPSSFKNQIESIKEMSERRQLQRLSLFLEDSASDVDQSINDIKDHVERSLNELHGEEDEWQSKTIGEVAREYEYELETGYQIHGVKTGITNLDNVIGCFANSRLYIVGGRPGANKTTIALNFANACADQDKVALFFNLEMSNREMIPRLITNELHDEYKIEYERFDRRDFTESEWGIVKEGLGRIKSKKIIVRDQPNMTVAA